MNATQWAALVYAAAAESSGGGIVSDINVTWEIVLAQAVGFLVLFVILWLAVFKRVGKTLDARQQTIADRLAKIEQDQADAAAAKEEMERQLADAQNEARRRIQEAVEQAEARAAQIAADARAAAEAEMERGRLTIEREKNEAILALRAEVADLAVDAARRLIGDTLNEQQGRQIVDQMIQQIAADE